MENISADPSKYYGVTVANGFGYCFITRAIGVKDVILAGAYDLYGRAG
jgi:hypothetical protein